MHLSRLDIRRLGQLRDVTLDPLSPQLTIVYGPNEAGKSTVRDAIRYALFGFPAKNPGKSAVDARTYAGADRHVGVRFEGADGDLHIERSVDGKKLSQGTLTVSPATAQPLLSAMTDGVDGQMYHAMWNVSLENLPTIDPSREGDSVLAKLHAAEHGTEVSPSAALAALTKEMDALFSGPKKDGPSVKTSVGRVVELRDQLGQAQRQAESIATVRAEYSSVSAAADAVATLRLSLQGRRAALSEDAANLDRLISESPAALERVRDAEQEYQLASGRAAAGQSEAIGRLLGLAGRVHSLELERALVEEKRRDSDRLRSSIDELTVKLARYRDVPQVLDGADGDRLIGQLDPLQRQIARSEEDLAIAQADLDAERQRADTMPDSPAGKSNLGPILAAIALVGGLASAGVSLMGGASTWTTVIVAAVSVVVAVAILSLTRQKRGSELPRTDDGRLAGAIANHRARQVSTSEARGAWDAFIQGEPILKPLADRKPEEVTVVVRQATTKAQLQGDLAIQEKLLERALAVQDSWAAAVGSVLSEAQVTGEAPLPSLDALADAVRAAELTVSGAGQAGESLPRLLRALEVAQDAQAQNGAALGSLLTKYSAATGADATSTVNELIGKADQDLAEAEGEHGELRSKLGELRHAIQVAESSHDVERLGADLESATSKLRAQTRAYVVSLLARTIIERGVEHFEGEGRPSVMESAGTVFTQLTGGAYEGVETTGNDGGDIEVVASDGSRKSVTHLSVGTIEQLYLAIRFGALLALPSRGRELPVLLDEVLANYDETRSAYGYGAVVELAANRQVIYFTCREEVVEGLRRAAAERNVETVQVSMDAGRVVG